NRTMEKARYERLQALEASLSAHAEGFRKRPPEPAFATLDQGAPVILKAFEAHLAPLTAFFAEVHRARLESRGRYVPAEHDDHFKHFNWRHLDNAEMALCPPFVVLVEAGAEPWQLLGLLLPVLTSGRPVKVVLAQHSLHTGVEETGRAAALQGGLDFALFFLALRNVYFLQTSPASQTPLEPQLALALESPRPAVVSLFLPSDPGENLTGGREAAARALLCRGFPHFVYNPDLAEDFVSCLHLEDNPDREAVWPKALLEYKNETGQAAQQERSYTFADYAAEEPEYAAQFRPLEAGEAASAIPLADYLSLPPEKHRDKHPFVLALEKNKSLVRQVPSPAMIAQTVDRMHLWRTLQELEGIRNPHVEAAERRVSERLSEEKTQALTRQREELEAKAVASGEQAVSAAMRNLALRLAGLAPLGGGAVGAAASPPVATAHSADNGKGALKAAPTPQPAEPEAPSAPVSETPWIDERVCTSCDDCITINKNIFAYNGNKKAYIKNAQGGPYKDIVKAAEKCSTGAIHPGMPLDRGEKDVDKWIKRAEAFQ
ncbi:MAG: ferredoxin, partial [Deltaproteobacteria bacterium]|nr:ferredoxin [Deltaproteobacteria bacterium]